MRREVKLRPKVLIFIGATLIVILGISFGLMLKQRERDALHRTSRLLEHIGHTVAQSMVRGMQEGDMESIQDLAGYSMRVNYPTATLTLIDAAPRAVSRRA